VFVVATIFSPFYSDDNLNFSRISPFESIIGDHVIPRNETSEKLFVVVIR